MKIKRKKSELNRKRFTIGFSKRTHKNSKSKHGNKYTKEDLIALRQLAYEFIFHSSLNNIDELQELGYESGYNKAFIEKHNVCHRYLIDLPHRPFFKQEYYDYVTSCISKDFASYLTPSLYKGNEKVKAMQVVMPEQVGKALTQRKVGLEGDKDDEDFRNEFFGVKKEKK